MKQRAVQGDIIAIPIGDTWIIVKVVFVSKHFKDIMMILVLRHARSPSLDEENTTILSGIYYTACYGFDKLGWKVIGRSPVAVIELEKTMRIIDGQVWKEDEVLRIATADDRSKLNMMLVSGLQALQNTLLAKYNKNQIN